MDKNLLADLSIADATMVELDTETIPPISRICFLRDLVARAPWRLKVLNIIIEQTSLRICDENQAVKRRLNLKRKRTSPKWCSCNQNSTPRENKE